MPGEVHRSTGNFTTLSKALCLADYLFPEAQLYYLGDTDMNLRAAGSSKHHAPTENAYMQSLIDSGRVIPILEDAAGEFHYSAPAPPVSSQGNVPAPDLLPVDTILISHPQWTDQFQMNENGDAGFTAMTTQPYFNMMKTNSFLNGITGGLKNF